MFKVCIPFFIRECLISAQKCVFPPQIQVRRACLLWQTGHRDYIAARHRKAIHAKLSTLNCAFSLRSSEHTTTTTTKIFNENLGKHEEFTRNLNQGNDSMARKSHFHCCAFTGLKEATHKKKTAHLDSKFFAYQMKFIVFRVYFMCGRIGK